MELSSAFAPVAAVAGATIAFAGVVYSAITTRGNAIRQDRRQATTDFYQGLQGEMDALRQQLNRTNDRLDAKDAQVIQLQRDVLACLNERNVLAQQVRLNEERLVELETENVRLRNRIKDVEAHGAGSN